MYSMREWLSIVSGTSLANALEQADTTLQVLAAKGKGDAFNRVYRDTQVLRDEYAKRVWNVEGTDTGQLDKDVWK